MNLSLRVPGAYLCWKKKKAEFRLWFMSHDVDVWSADPDFDLKHEESDSLGL